MAERTGTGSYTSVAASDRLGSEMSYYPYGDEKGTVTAQERVKFATYWRDGESGLDYAMNRYYSAAMGRFLSPDPYGWSMNPASPESFNRYAYVGNDPVNSNDPAGLDGDFPPPATPPPPFGCDLFGGCVPGCPAPALWDGSDYALPQPDGFMRLPNTPPLICWYRLLPGVAFGFGPNSHRTPEYLQVTQDCYRVPERGPVTREISYVLYDDSAIPLRYTHAVVTENLTGDLPSTGPSTSGPDNGTFTDQHSVLLGKNPAQLTQSFTISSDDGRFVNLPVFVRGFGGDYNVLAIYKTARWIKINEDYGGTFSSDGTFIPNKLCP